MDVSLVSYMKQQPIKSCCGPTILVCNLLVSQNKHFKKPIMALL